jgi:putative DNA primase/helicase
MKKILNSLFYYRRKGFSVIPIKTKGKTPIIEWKQFQEERATRKQIESWWRDYPNANIGIVTGAISDIVVIDCDSKTAAKAFEKTYPEAKSTLQVVTGRGKHFYFRWADGIRNNVASRLGEGIDVRGEGGFVVAPPSIHETGKKYQWLNKKKICPLPGELKAILMNSRNKETVTAPGGALLIKEGRRNEILFSLACAMRSRGTGLEAIQAALHAENQVKCDTPLSESEVSTIAESAMRYSESPKTENLTDSGNARRFADQHGTDLRYCHLWNKWLVWNGFRWRRDETGEVSRRAKDTVRRIYAEASSIYDEKVRPRLSQHAVKSEGAHAIKAMIYLAQSEPGMALAPNDLDANPWLLNVKNGTINLRDGTFYPPRREDLLTKLAPVEYDPMAKCPTWDNFLSRIMDDSEEMIEFLQRSIGYALTGDVSEQCLFFFYGTGANGKTTFLNTIQEMLGDYAKSAAPDLLVKKHGDSHPTDRADLQGSRFVVTVEVEAGKQMAEALVKQLTGGDKIKARFMRQDLFEFPPTFKLFFAANHKPPIRGTDYAIWRRIRLVPFNVTIPDSEQDKRLPEKLKEELPGILVWAVKGCLAWWKNKDLGIPKEVEKATSTYRSEMDVLEIFLKDNCVIGNKNKVKAGELYEVYSKWCDQNGERAKLNNRDFSQRLKEKGYENNRGKGGNFYWGGIALNERAADSALPA